MEGKRRGRALRWSLYRATTANKLPPFSTTVLHLPYATKAKPNPAADHGGYMKMLNQQEHLRPTRPHQSYNNNNNNVNNIPPAHQLSQLPTHTRSVSYYPSTPDNITNNTAVDSYSTAAKKDTVYGGAVVDEAVDLKAANYISSVREKFRLDYLN